MVKTFIVGFVLEEVLRAFLWASIFAYVLKRAFRKR
jgi:hypothetical protein